MNKPHPLSSRWLQVALNLATLVIVLVLNTLANALPLNGRTTAEISDSFNLRFVPAGYVFSIWGLIYLALLAFTVFQALPAQQANRAVRATGFWYALSNAANAAWIVCWHYGYYTLTVILMLTLLTSLIVLYRRLAKMAHLSAATRWLVHAPFSLYLGWITVATVANVSAWLVDLGWDGRPLDPVTWTVALIAVAAGLGLTLEFRRRDLIYAGVIVWATVGIAIRQADSLLIVAASAMAVMTLVIGAVLITLRPQQSLLARRMQDQPHPK
jgi:hypothetical protein